jgi:hypothetical protein
MTIQRWDLLASMEEMHETPEGEFVRYEDMVEECGRLGEAHGETLRELASVRERYQAEDDVLAAAEAWLVSWPELDDLAEAGKLGGGEARLYRAVKALRKVMR